MPQRGFARELQAEVKNGNIKLIYPQGQNRDITLSALNGGNTTEFGTVMPV